MKAYKIKLNKNQWQVNKWSDYYQAWVASETVNYWQACAMVREANK